MRAIVKGHIIFDHDGTLVKMDHSGANLFPGMKDLLKKLKSENYELYVWTARGRSSTINSLKSFEISSFFNEIYCHDDGIPKPHPMGLQKLTEGIEKKMILHIGDGLGDYEGAKHFGIDFIFAAWNDPEFGRNFKKLMPNIAFDLVECKKIIDSKFNFKE